MPPLSSKNRTPNVRRTTLKDIANLAGVSVSTASLVLAGKSADRRISREVERRVRELAQQHDYTPNLLVKSIQHGKTNVLAFYNSFRKRERNDLYMDRLTTTLQREAGNHGYDILTYCDFSRPTDAFYRHINGGLSDGLLFFGPFEDDPLLPLLRESRLPTVLLLHEDTEGKLCSVTEDMRDGISQIAAGLVALGHRRIGAVTSAPGSRSDSERRIALLRNALHALGAELLDDFILPVANDNRYPAEALLERILNASEPPTALFCWHDRVGYTVLEGCDRLGIKVPEQLTLVGYDGLHWPSTSSHILTSVAVDIDRAAVIAIELLRKQIDGEPLDQREHVLPVRWEPGTTFGKAPSA